MGGNLLLEYVGVKSKAYALRKLVRFTKEKKLENNTIIEIKKLKGVQSYEVDQNLSFDIYKQSIFEEKTILTNNIRFHTDLHKVKTVLQRKVGLTAYDDKRYICDDGIKSLPFNYQKFV